MGCTVINHSSDLLQFSPHFSPFQTLKTTLQVDNMSEMSEASGQSQLTSQTRPQLMSMGIYKINLGTK